MYSYKKLLKLVLTSHIHKKAFGESEIPNIHVLCRAISDKKSENFKNLCAFAQRGEETHQSIKREIEAPIQTTPMINRSPNHPTRRNQQL